MPFDPLTVVFAVVAVLVIWKLNSVLGQNTGLQRPKEDAARKGMPPKELPSKSRIGDRDASGAMMSGPQSASQQPLGSQSPGSQSNVVRLPGSVPPADPARWNAFVEAGSSAGLGLNAISAADPTFAADPFLDGARTAYEAVVTAFAAGERRTLQNLLARDVYDGFNAAILDREKKKETLSTTFVSIDDAKFHAASLDGQMARVAVRFLSKQISATHGADGSLRGGSPDAIFDMDDIWTFSRDVRSGDPNWKLVATDSGR